MESNQIRARRLCTALSCPQPGKFTCSGCSGTWYCSKDCQASDWPLSHKFKCDAGEPTTADYLLQACLVGHVPWDGDTLHDYGFMRSWNLVDHDHLMDLYKELLLGQGVRSKTLHRWLTRGVLAEEIDKTFKVIPTELHGPGYIWFSENQWVLDGDQMKMCPNSIYMDSIYIQDGGWLRKAWAYRGYPEPTKCQMEHMLPKMSPDERDCMEFCGVVLGTGNFASRSQEMLVRFGFCTLLDATDAFELSTLSSFYLRLLRRCTFEEFFQAYKSSQLFNLFASRGLADELRRAHPLIEDVLKPSPNPGLSVWYLKMFMLYPNPGDDPPITVPKYIEATEDFGFINCESEGEYFDLRAVYETLFRRTNCSPPELYQAVLEGKLFKFVTKWLKLAEKQKFKRLMVRKSGEGYRHVHVVYVPCAELCSQ